MGRQEKGRGKEEWIDKGRDRKDKKGFESPGKKE